MNKTLLEDCKRIEKIMDKTAKRADIWQDRFIYWIAVAIYHIILHLRKETKDVREDRRED